MRACSSKGNTALGATFLFGLGLAIWSANAGVKAVIDALNVVYEEREKRGFIQTEPARRWPSPSAASPRCC